MRLSKSLALDPTNFAILPKFLAGDIGKETVETVVTSSGIIVKFAQGGSCGSADFVFNFLAVDHIGGVGSRNATSL